MTYLTSDRDALAMALVENDPDPCDPIEYDAAAYYRDFADALIASGAVTPADTLADDVAKAINEHADHMATYTLPALQPGFMGGWEHALRLLRRDAGFIASRVAAALTERSQ